MARRDEAAQMVERRSQPPRRHGALRRGLYLGLAVAILVGAVVLAFSPTLRARLFGNSPSTVTLEIRSTPEGAEAFVDDELVGLTPVTVHVSAAAHRIRIVKRGYRPWHELVDPVSTHMVVVTLPPVVLARLDVHSEPSQAEVFLDEDRLGVTPIEARETEAGPHTILVKKEPLYRSATQRIELKEGETRRLTVRLPSRVEEMQEESIRKEPGKLSSYTELLRLQILKGEGERAAGTVSQALRACEGEDSSATEMSQFCEEARKVVRGQAGTLGARSREKLLAELAAFLGRTALLHPSEHGRYGPVMNILLQAGRFEDVRQACEGALQNPASGGIVHQYAGAACLHLGEAAHAIRLLERAVELQPTLLTARLPLASAYHQTGRLDDALRQYRDAEKVASQASPYHQGLLQVELARLMVSRSDIEGAIACYKKAMATNAPVSYRCLWRLRFAELLQGRGRTQEAIEQYRETARAFPDSEPGLAALKALQRLEGK